MSVIYSITEDKINGNFYLWNRDFFYGRVGLFCYVKEVKRNS